MLHIKRELENTLLYNRAYTSSSVCSLNKGRGRSPPTLLHLGVRDWGQFQQLCSPRSRSVESPSLSRLELSPQVGHRVLVDYPVPGGLN